MNILKKTALIIVLALIVAFDQSCKTLERVSQTLINLKDLQFKLENVTGFRLAGIGLSNKSQASDFSAADAFSLAQAFATNKFPAEFTLNVAVKNPNDGTKGSKQSIATLTRLDWHLYIDDVSTVSGVINESIDVPGTGMTTIIPVRISLDLYKFFKNKSYDGILNLALSLGGVKSSPTRLKLDLKPTISTPLGPIPSPMITIVDFEYR